MGYILWGLGRKLTALQRHRTVWWSSWYLLQQSKPCCVMATRNWFCRVLLSSVSYVLVFLYCQSSMNKKVFQPDRAASCTSNEHLCEYESDANNAFRLSIQQLCKYEMNASYSAFPLKDITRYDRVNKALNLSCNHCFLRNHISLHEPQGLCRVWPGQEHEVLDVVFVILSKPEDEYQRSVLRSSWTRITLSNRAPRFRHVFVLGSATNISVQQNIDVEKRQYNDILQKNISEGIRKITKKTLDGLEWVSKHCNHARFVMKVDSDSYVNIATLISFISSLAAENGIFGSCRNQDKPTRNPVNRLYIPRSIYPAPYCAPYCWGGGYTLSMEAVGEVVRLAPDVPPIALEDVFVGWCLRESRFNGNKRYRVYHVANFMAHPDKTDCKKDCRDINNAIVWHKSTPEFLQCAWKKCYRQICPAKFNNSVIYWHCFIKRSGKLCQRNNYKEIQPTKALQVLRGHLWSSTSCSAIITVTS